MSEIKLEAGQWYRTRGGSLVRCVDGGVRYVGSFVFESHNSAYYVLSDGRHVCGNSNWDVVEHLPDCTGFDWEPPKPVVAPEGWRLLTEGDEITVDDLWLDTDRKWRNFTFMSSDICGSKWNQDRHPFMARKIEPKYRPFKDDVEYQPERERWFRHKIDLYVTRVTCFTERNIWVGAATVGTSYAEAFEAFEFLDGTPFGVRVDD